MERKICISLYVLVASILLSALAVAWAIRSQPVPEADPAAEAAERCRLEKVAEISTMVLNREVVPAEYSRYLDEELAEAVKEYNTESSYLREFYVQYAEKNIRGLAQYYQDSGMELPLFCTDERVLMQAAHHIASCALYREPYCHYGQDPAAQRIAMKESGGSGGLWLDAPHWGHNLMMAGADREEVRRVERYLDQVDALLDALDAECGYVPPEAEEEYAQGFAEGAA